MIEPYILKMRPYLRPKIWGGRKLQSTFDKALPDDRPYGEAWEVADLDEGESTIVNGPLAGEPLSKVVERWPDALQTPDSEQAFPLLVKILDAQDDLSVQVHPSREAIAEFGLDGHSKDECWLILEAEPDGCILHGFEEEVDPSDFRAAVDQERAAQMLRRVEVEAGDVIRVQPGTVHAICTGVCLLEIQEPSDTTYRVYDYGRPGMDGNPRELHLQEAMKVADFGAHPPAKLEPMPSESAQAVDILVDAPSYRIERARPADTLRWEVGEAGPQVVFCSKGAVRLEGRGGEVSLAFGQTAVIPGGLGSVELTPESAGDAEVIVAGSGGEPLL
ncbi:MAG: type I phosphomannose isomerase catalytic subunit [Persicimonas sp.]